MSNGCHCDTGLATSCVFSYKVQYSLWLTQSTAASNCDLGFPREQHCDFEGSLWLLQSHPSSLGDMNRIHGVIRHRRHVTGLSSFLLLVFASEDTLHVAPGGICGVTGAHSCSSPSPSPSPEALCVCGRCWPIVSCWLERQPLVPAVQGKQHGSDPAPLQMQPQLSLRGQGHKEFKYYAKQQNSGRGFWYTCSKTSTKLHIYGKLSQLKIYFMCHFCCVHIFRSTVSIKYGFKHFLALLCYCIGIFSQFLF